MEGEGRRWKGEGKMDGEGRRWKGGHEMSETHDGEGKGKERG